jgi:hypothetical protein
MLWRINGVCVEGNIENLNQRNHDGGWKMKIDMRKYK